MNSLGMRARGSTCALRPSTLDVCPGGQRSFEKQWQLAETCDFGCRIRWLGFRVENFGVRVQICGCRVKG